ncbi:MAG: M48 family metalloprotease [Burkholderiaceae bacterium]|nr:M48 family metalloprotease [Burkholderiaceae bacterium]
MPHPARRLIVALLSCALALPAGVAPARAQAPELPALGDVAFDDLSPANERRFGEQIMRQVRRDPAYLADPDTHDYLNALGFKLVSVSPARYMDFEFFAVRDPMLNAFAFPGGFIGVHSGLVLGAERHIARMLAKQREGSYIAIGALLLALLAARGGSSSSGDAAQAAIMAGQAAAVQQQLNFSREAEREADRVGYQTLVAAGFDPGGMASFFSRLQQGTRIYESAAPEYLRTHPLTVERLSDMQNRARDARVRPRPDSLEFHLVRARLRVLQDESPQGLRDSALHFRGQIDSRTAHSLTAAYYGLALASMKLADHPVAVEAARNARLSSQAPAPMLDKIVSQTLFAAARSDAERAEAVRLAGEAAARYPVSRLTALHYADLLQRNGQHEAAVTFLREQLALPRSDARLFELLARNYERLGRRTLQHQATAELYLLLGSAPAAIDQLQQARRANDADFYTMSEVDARLRQVSQQLREYREQLAREGRAPPDEDKRPRR